ncbi:dymeclin-like [Dorcoceras hygrometricum]|uniref:Dymeclin-like n=1 Tax=Dorcoceras hygrometricum TaxID=472368 RepID=A0A2Z7B9R5_9LAMI|nr:dymeclin-like [Dorcoceras hygrometricum]
MNTINHIAVDQTEENIGGRRESVPFMVYQEVLLHLIIGILSAVTEVPKLGPTDFGECVDDAMLMGATRSNAESVCDAMLMGASRSNAESDFDTKL